MATTRGEYVVNNLKKVLEELNYSSIRVARGLGVSKEAVSNWKMNYKRIGDDNLASLCFLLKKNPEELVKIDFTEFKQKYKLPNFKNDKIQVSNNPGKQRDKGGDG